MEYIPLILVFAFMALMLLSMRRQRQGLDGQGRALSQVDESLALSRRAVELQEETNALLRELLSKKP